MSTLASPRGPLPPRVYWARRLVLLALVALLGTGLVAGFAHLLGSGSNGGGGQAGPVADSSALPGAGAGASRSSAPTSTAGAVPTGAPPSTPADTVTGPRGRVRTLLADPAGPCAPSDLLVQPVLLAREAGRDVPVKLRLTSRTSAACTFDADGSDVVVRITSGDDRIWTTQDCPRAVDARSVVPRSSRAAVVTMTWDARRSLPGCPEPGGWARPGWYHVTAAVLGGEPTDVQFRLTLPQQATRTETIVPTPKPSRQDAAHRATKREHRKYRRDHRRPQDLRSATVD